MKKVLNLALGLAICISFSCDLVAEGNFRDKNRYDGYDRYDGKAKGYSNIHFDGHGGRNHNFIGQHNDYHRRHISNYNNAHHTKWAAPLIIGGLIGLGMASTQSTQRRDCDIVYEKTISYRTPVYEDRWIFFNDCNCYKKVTVEIR